MNIASSLRIDNKDMRIGIVDYDLEPIALYYGTPLYDTVPLPSGNLKLVVNDTIYFSERAFCEVQQCMEQSIYILITEMHIRTLLTNIVGVLTYFYNERKVSTFEENLGYVITGQPEYFYPN